MVPNIVRVILPRRVVSLLSTCDCARRYPKLKAVFDGIMAMEKIQALDVPFSRADFRLTPDAESLALFAAAGADAAAGGAEAAAAPAAAPAAE